MSGRSGAGIFTAMRARASDVARLLVVALVLQFGVPFGAHAGSMNPEHVTGPSSVDTIAICTIDGMRYVHADGSPAGPPADSHHGSNHDCCMAGCDRHLAVTPGSLPLVAVTRWTSLPPALSESIVPHALNRLSPSPRGPPPAL